MADNRIKNVRARLADLASRSNYILDKIDRTDGEVSRGDSLDLPGISALTVTADGGGTAVTPQSIVNDTLTMTIDSHPAVFIDIPRVDSIQSLSGAWVSAISEQAFTSLRNSMDESFLSNASTVAAYSATAAYTSNVAANALAQGDFLDAMGKLGDQDGANESNMMWVLAPWAEIAVRNFTAFQPNGMAAERGEVGVPELGTLYGIPVFQTRSTLRSRAVATTAVTIATNVATATVAAGHGLVAGEVVTTTGLTTNVADVAITSVTATTIVYACTAGDGAFGDGVGTITSNAERSMLIDKTFAHAAVQAMPDTRVKPVRGSTTEELEVSAVFGYATRPGRAINIYGPVGSL